MTAAGEAVLNVAYGEVGYVEGPDNSTKYWDWYGANLGPWCGVFCMWCSEMAGYPVCTDTVLVSNGTWHGYTTAGSGATGVEAQRTLDLQPGDFVVFSWEPWAFEDGVPICQGEWQGSVAGDHIGIFAYDLGGGRFASVEGNTSDGSWDNGGMVMLREDRYHSQVCGWWRQENIAGAGTTPTPEPPKGWLDMLTDQQQTDLYQWVQATFWATGNTLPAAGIPTISDRVATLEQKMASVYWMVGNQDPQAGAETVSSDARAARANTERLLEQGG
jgi:hypothetical protein